MISKMYERLTIPEKDRLTSIRKKEGEFIYRLLQQQAPKITLETGLAYGCSAAYIISATQSRHYAMDPFQEDYHDLGIANIRKLGLSKFLEFRRDYSHNVLPELLKQGINIDFAFIDGDHKFDGIFIDFYFVDLMLDPGGHVILHDSWLRSTQHVASWIKKNKTNYQFIQGFSENLLLFKKISNNDNRTWHHFKSFFTPRSYFINRIFGVFFEMKKYFRKTSYASRGDSRIIDRE